MLQTAAVAPIARRLAAPVLALAALIGLPAMAEPGGFERTSDGVVVSPAGGAAGRVRVQVIDDRIFRVTAAPGADLDTPKSLVAVAQARKDGFEVQGGAGSVRVRTPAMSAEVSLDTGAVSFLDAKGGVVLAERAGRTFTPIKMEGRDYLSMRQRFISPADEAFYGLGQHQKGVMNYKGHDVELAQHNMDIGVPFVVSSRNYGLLWDNPSITRFGDPREYRLISAGLKVTDETGKPGGLTARYYVGNALKLTRSEPDIDYHYIKDLKRWPAQVKGAKDQKVVWTGKVEASSAGRHKFQLYSSNYAKVFVDGKLVIDAWRQNWNPWYRDFQIDMAPGQAHDLRVEWIPNDGYLGLVHLDPQPAEEAGDLSLWSEAGKAVDYYFVGGDDLDDIVAGYRKVSGKAVMLPRWAYGFWQSRQRYNTQDELLGVLREYRKRQIPLDNMVQDWFYWPESAWGSHDFDTARYPDPKAMVDEIHAANANIMISVWPKFYPTTANYKELDAVGGVYRRNVELGHKDWVGPGYLSTYYDPYSKPAGDIYWRQIREKLDVLGFDAWWLDNDEPDIHSNLSIEERKYISGPTALGPGGAYFNTFPLVHVGGVYDHWRVDHPDTRAFLFTRSAWAGMQRYAGAVWSGDVSARWSDLREQISAGVNISMSGIPNWTFDIGGFSVEDRYQKPDAAALDEWRELNLRWFQFGAFAPIFRSHGEAPLREIYNLAPEGSEVYDSLVWYDRLRYRLMPYVYTLAADTFHRDGTMMRGLVMDFPADLKVREIADQYLFGPSFLVAPVSAWRARSRPVYLPAGTAWYDLYSGERFAGGRTIDAAAPLARMPVFVRAGAIVPTGPAVQHTGEKLDGPITLVVYRGADGRFDLYEDDGKTYGYERDRFARIPISYRDSDGAVTIGARAGAYEGMPERRTFKVRWISGKVAGATDFDVSDKQVEYDGKQVVVTR
jgi:alpha-D-xyloside xylohydrolase